MSTFEEAEAKQWCIVNGLIFDPFGWMAWRSVFLLIPKKSINGKTIWGPCHTRDRVEAKHHRYHRIYQYATKKEVFEAKLKGEQND